MGEHYKINNKELYIEDIGDKELPVILYIHGRPGVGVMDFIAYQAELLKNKFRIIAPEQRGVWRSEALHDDEKYSLKSIVDDYEEIRKVFNVEKWSIIAHSLGAYTAVLYHKFYYQAINCMIFESPIFSLLYTDKAIMKYQVEQVARLKGIDVAETYIKSLKEVKTHKQLEQLLKLIYQELGNNASDYLMGENTRERIDILKKQFDTNEGLFGKSRLTDHKMLQEGLIYHSIFDEFANIKKPCLIMRGKTEVMSSKKQVDKFLNEVENSEILEFENSRHWIRIDEPEKYSKTVTDYIYHYIRL